MMAHTQSSADFGKGFDDPVLGSQRCFRLVLAAMSEPGTIHRLDETIATPANVSPAAALVLLTLADLETPVWIAPRFGAAAAFVRFHCGAPIVEAPSDASFALLDGISGEPAHGAFGAGDERYPDRSATLIVQCSSLEGGNPVRLSGPGIERSRLVAPDGLHGGFWPEVATNHARYPLGVDLILAAGDRIFALPRSTCIALDDGAR